METDLLSRFEWPVAVGGYQWVETDWGTALTAKPDQPGPPSRYLPFSKGYAGLFRTFAELVESGPSKEAVLTFANRYGMLGAPVARLAKDIRVAAEPEALSRQSEAGKFVEHLDPDPNVGDAQWCWKFQLYAMYQTLLEENELREHIEKAPTQRDSVTEDGIQWSARFVSSKIEKALALTMAPRLVWSPDREDFRLRIAPRSLLGALWMQFAESLSSSVSLRRCKVCSRLIQISKVSPGAREDARLCSDKCRAKAYRERKKKARQLAETGWRVARIAKTLGSDRGRVKAWLKAKK